MLKRQNLNHELKIMSKILTSQSLCISWPMSTLGTYMWSAVMKWRAKLVANEFTNMGRSKHSMSCSDWAWTMNVGHIWLHMPKKKKKRAQNPLTKNEFNTYPFSSPVCKFLDWEKGVVGESREDWELSEGIAKEGNGELKVAARAKESSLDRSKGFGFGIWKVASGIWRQSEVLMAEGLEVGKSGGSRWPIKLMFGPVCLSFPNQASISVLCSTETLPFNSILPNKRALVLFL